MMLAETVCYDQFSGGARNVFLWCRYFSTKVYNNMNILSAGTETSASTMIWAMTLLIKNPKSLNKLQQEVRNALGTKGKVDKDDLYKLDYLKAVIKETLRLYPVLPLLIPRESRERCVLAGYEVPKKTMVYVNAWAVGRDPKFWERPEEFEPERFMGGNLEYKGVDFEWIPFGFGRRGCPGLLLGATTTTLDNLSLALSNLIYSFDWEMPEGTKDIDTMKTDGTVIHKKNPLQLIVDLALYGALDWIVRGLEGNEAIRLKVVVATISMVSFLIILSAVLLFFLFLLPTRRFLSKTRPLPPGPPGLPIIGNLHQLDTSDLSDYLWRLSKRYGPLMSLRLGHVHTLVVSSAEMAKEIMKTNDLVFCTRPILTGQQKISYDNKDIALSPYNEYWRQMRKICTLHLFSMKQVNSFRSVREEEVFDMINRMKTQSSMKQIVNLSDDAMELTSNIICRVAFGKRPSAYNNRKEGTRISELMSEFQEVLTNFYYRDHFPLMGWLDKLNGSIARLEKLFKNLDEFYQEVIDEHLNQNQPNKMEDDMVDILLKLKQDYANDLSFDHVKGVLMDILSGGTETSASTVVWAMTLLIKNPDSLKKAQQEVRNAIGMKGKVEEDDLYKLNYLKAVIKETLRLYPVLPLLIPRESRDRCVLEGFEIPKKTLVYINAWAVGRDPKCWERPEEFEPERFMDSSVEYKGTNFEWIPFGSGRRGCPGLLLGATTVELALSNLVYSFDWELPEGTKYIDTLKSEGTVVHKKNALLLAAKVPIMHGCKSS
ncbi:hypothetical protein M8C21_015232 [Ambrosia artemisiifolia]|uniref:Cytochrome P450 n=1 Tax=Ambrosia artemisiifolia TaxID=4212 RepID=A0AAD5C2M6_AMBAR|nr:hypothetical protein M8C21_015232 [Ambrosia artemisiifolia]